MDVMSPAEKTLAYPSDSLLDTKLAVVPELSEADVRAFYDPTGAHNDTEIGGFIDGVAASRHETVLPKLGWLNGHEVILAEVTHAKLPHGKGVSLPIKEKRYNKIVGAINTYAGATAMSIVDVADELVQARVNMQRAMPERRWRPLPSSLEMAGKVVAATGHEGAFRRSGRPYFDHPDEVATIIELAWNKRSQNMDDPLLDVVRYLAYAHDVFEDTIDPFADYLSKKSLVISPLVTQKVLEVYRYPTSEAESIARTLLYMSRLKDVNKNRLTYPEYIERGIRLGKELFILTKSPDIQHNLNIEPEHIQPGDVKTHQKFMKREMYREAAGRLAIAADEYPGQALIVHSVFHISPNEVRRASSGSSNVEISAVADRVNQKLQDRLLVV